MADEEDYSGVYYGTGDGEAQQADDGPTFGDYLKTGASGVISGAIAPVVAGARALTNDSENETASSINKMSKVLQGYLNIEADNINSTRSESAKRRAEAAVTSKDFWDHPVSATMLKATGMAGPIAAMVFSGGPIGAAIVGGALNAGSYLNDLDKALDAAPDAKLQENEWYASLRSMGMSEADARDDLKQKLLDNKVLLNFAAGAIGGAFGPAGKLAAGVSGKATVGLAGAEAGAVRRGVAGAAEGAGAGALEGGTSAATLQQSEQEAGLRKDFDGEALVNAVLEGGLLGGVMGGAAGAAIKSKSKKKATADVVETTTDQGPQEQGSGEQVSPVEAAPQVAPQAPDGSVAPAPVPGAKGEAVKKKGAKPKLEITVVDELSPAADQAIALADARQPVQPNIAAASERTANPTPDPVAPVAELAVAPIPADVVAAAQRTAPPEALPPVTPEVTPAIEQPPVSSVAAPTKKIGFSFEQDKAARYPRIDHESGERLYRFNADGKDGELIVEPTDGGKNLYVRWVAVGEGNGTPNAIGPANTRKVLSALREEFPDAETISGARASGAKSDGQTWVDTKVTLGKGKAKAEAIKAKRAPKVLRNLTEDGLAPEEVAHPKFKSDEAIAKEEADIASGKKKVKEVAVDENGDALATGRKMSPKMDERIKAHRAASDEIVAAHPATEAEADYFTDHGAFNAVIKRAQAMIAAADAAGHKVPSQIKPSAKKNQVTDHPNTQLLVYAKNLVTAAKSKAKGTKIPEAVARFKQREDGVKSGRGAEELAERRAEGDAAMRRDQGDAGERGATTDTPESILAAKEAGSTEDNAADIKAENAASKEQDVDAKDNVVETQTGVAKSAKGPVRGVSDGTETRTVKTKAGKEAEVEGAKAASEVKKVAVSDEMKAKYAAMLEQANRKNGDDSRLEAAEAVNKKTARVEKEADVFDAALVKKNAPPADALTGEPVAIIKTQTARQALAGLNLTHLAGVPKQLAAFMQKRLAAMAGDIPVHMLGKEEFARATGKLEVAFQNDGEGVLGMSRLHPSGSAHQILIRGDVLRNPQDTAHVVMHEIAHGATQRALVENAEIHEQVKSVMAEVKEALRGARPEVLDAMEYAMTNPREFIAEAFSNPRVQETLSRVTITGKLAQQLKLDQANPLSVWDAIVAVVRSIIEKSTGRLPEGHRAVDAILRIGETIGRENNRQALREHTAGAHIPVKQHGLSDSLDDFDASMRRDPSLTKNPRKLKDDLDEFGNKEPPATFLERKNIDGLGANAYETATRKLTETSFGDWRLTDKRTKTYEHVSPEEGRALADLWRDNAAHFDAAFTTGDAKARGADLWTNAKGKVALGKDMLSTLRQMADRSLPYFGPSNPTNRMFDLVSKQNTMRSDILKSEGGLDLIRRGADIQRADPKGMEKGADLLRDAAVQNVNLGPGADNSHLGKNATKGWQAKKQLADLNRRYKELKDEAPEVVKYLHEYVEHTRDIHNKVSMQLIENTLDAANIKQAGLAERIFKDGVTDDDRVVYENTIVNALHKATTLKEMKGWYMPFRRYGEFISSGHHELVVPKGALKVADDTIQFFGAKTKIASLRAAKAFVEQDSHTPQGTHLKDAAIQKVFVKKSDPTKLTDPTDIDGITAYRVRMQTQHTEMHDTRAEAEHSAAAFKTAGLREDSISTHKREDAHHASPGLEGSLSTVIRSLEHNEKYQAMEPAQRGAIKQALLNASIAAMSSTNVKTSMAHRKNVAGMSTDIVRVLSDYVRMTSNYRAQLHYRPQIDKVFGEMRDHMKAYQHDKKSVRRDELYAEFQSRIYGKGDFLAQREANPVIRKLLQVSRLTRLAGVSFHVINSHEPWTTSLPLIGGRHGFTQAARTMTGIYNAIGARRGVVSGLKDVAGAFQKDGGFTDYVKMFKDNIAKSNTMGGSKSSRFMEMIDYMAERGLYSDDAIAEVGKTANPTSNVVGRALDRADLMANQVGSAIEAINRTVTGLTAYDLEFKKNGGNHEAALHYAYNLAHKAMGDYSAWNAAPIFNTRAGQVAFQFKKFGQKTYYMLGETIGRAVRGDHEAMRQFAGLMVTHGLVAGALGMPTEPFKVALMAAGFMGATSFTPEDYDNSVRQLAARVAGQKGGEIISKGLYRGVGIEVSGRMGLDSMFTYGNPKSDKANDLKAWLFDTMAGAPAGYLLDQVAAATALSKGDLATAIQKASPVRAVGDVAKAVTGAMGPKLSPQGREIHDALGPWETGVRAIGFTPSRVAESGAMRGHVARESKKAGGERSELINAWVTATGAKKVSAQRAVQKWNAGNSKELHIAQKDLASAAKRRATEEENGSFKDGIKIGKRTKEIYDRAAATYSVR